MRLTYRRYSGFAAVLALYVAGMASVHATLFVVDDLSRVTNIEKITILPVVVLAELPDDNEEKLLNLVRKQLALELALKGYTLKRVNKYSPEKDLVAADVGGMSLEELASLGPSNATHLMILFVNALDGNFIGIADSSDAKLAAVLIEKATGDLLWKNEADRNFTASWFNWGFIGMLIINEDEMAIWSAFKELFKEFPDRPM
jgi:hypothetical protein